MARAFVSEAWQLRPVSRNDSSEFVEQVPEPRWAPLAVLEWTAGPDSRIR